MTTAKIVVFDIDGTLTNSIECHQQAFLKALQSFQFPNLRTDWASYQHHSDSAIFAEAWQESGYGSAPDVKEFEQRFNNEYNLAIHHYPFSAISGALEFIQNIQKIGWRVAFATGSLRHAALHKLKILGIDGHQQILVTASEFQTREDIVKQAVEIALSRYFVVSQPSQSQPSKTQLSQVISIGDGIWDFKTAQNLGYDFIGIGLEKINWSTFGVSAYADFTQILQIEQNRFEFLK
ncbi:MAG: HAD hydrolase-like protein [Acinetobacter sp.]